MSGTVTKLSPTDRDGRAHPHDLEAERALLAAMVLSADARLTARAMLLAGDFYRPQHGDLFVAILDLHDCGEGVDVRTIADRLRRAKLLDAIGGEAGLGELFREMPATTSIRRYCRIVAEMAVLRKIIGACGEAIAEARDLPTDVAGFLDGFAERFKTIEAPVVVQERSMTLDEFYDISAGVDDWIIPRFLQRGERLIVVASEGAGKSTFARQLAVASAQGVHPFTLTDRVEPIRTLLIDLENRPQIINKSLDRFLSVAVTKGGEIYDADRMRIWHQSAGIDIRGRADFARMDAILAESRPDLVCIGPLRKLFRTQRGETYEESALDVTSRLDDLASRHGFALVIEHHAPKGPYGHREMAPFGSSVWMSWPDFGIGLASHPEAPAGKRGWCVLSHWRGPRDVRPWPEQLTWGSTWPWEFHWDKETDNPTGYSKQVVDQDEMF